MTRCQRPGCDGVLAADGFCDWCGLPAEQAAANSPALAPSPAPSDERRPEPPPTDSGEKAAAGPVDQPVDESAGGLATVPASDRDLSELTPSQGKAELPPPRTPLPAESAGPLIGGVVALPALPEPTPESLVLTGDAASVPEPARFCPNCREPAGRGRAGQPGLTTGFCPRCGTPFSFLPKLAEGDRVGRYEIVGPLGHGGVGWVYLAKDTALADRLVALKTLLDPTNPDTAATPVSELRHLLRLDHPNIVRVRDFVTHPDPSTGEPVDHIVMDLVRGWTLDQVKRGHELPLEAVIGYGLVILDALAYLHGRGYLYCDLKPDNVMHGERVWLIDMGAVREVGDRDSPAWGARGYRPSAEEFANHGLTVRSDLYSLGRTLAAVFADTVDDLPADADSPIGVAVASFRAVLARAVAPWPERFTSAEDMADQLVRVAREARALRGESPRPEPSRLFAQPVTLFDAGLGAVLTLEHWTITPASEATLRHGVRCGDGRPHPGLVAAGLPDPLPDPDDPAAAELSTVSATDPRRLLRELARLAPSVETMLWRARAHIARAEHPHARHVLNEAAELGRDDPAARWRVTWHRGLILLAEDRVPDAREQFAQVRAAVPGEATPKVALGYCAECADAVNEARDYYEAAWRADKTHVSAAFGLARIALAAGDRGAAARVLDEVPRTSRHYDTAKIAAFWVKVGEFHAAPPPEPEDLCEGAERLTELRVDQEARARLTAAVRQAAYAQVRRAPWPDLRPTDAARATFGHPVTATRLRPLLEASFRRLSRQAADEAQFGTLLDLANTIRRRSLT